MGRTARYHKVTVMRRSKRVPPAAGAGPRVRPAGEPCSSGNRLPASTRSGAGRSLLPFIGRSLCLAGSLALVAGCGGGKQLARRWAVSRPGGGQTAAAPGASSSGPPVDTTSGPPVDTTQPPAASPGPAPPQPAPMCPEGMAYVDTRYCPKLERRCVKDEDDKSNHITICHKFAPATRCLSTPRRQRFCIDKYEYPNQEGAHPPVMVDWYDAAGACASRGKRLCWESEWVSACEGPDNLPFPYGLNRDPAQCNIDNPWLTPAL